MRREVVDAALDVGVRIGGVDAEGQRGPRHRRHDRPARPWVTTAEGSNRDFRQATASASRGSTWWRAEAASIALATAGEASAPTVRTAGGGVRRAGAGTEELRRPAVSRHRPVIADLHHPPTRAARQTHSAKAANVRRGRTSSAGSSSPFFDIYFAAYFAASSAQRLREVALGAEVGAT